MTPFSANKPVVVYYMDFTVTNVLEPPTAHAIIQGTDTLFFRQIFYGGADVKHAFKPAAVEGRITRINRTQKEQILSIIVSPDIFVEINPLIAKQLAPLLTKGRHIAVSGDERVKLEGEIYEKDYRIISPAKLVIEGKEFLINP